MHDQVDYIIVKVWIISFINHEIFKSHIKEYKITCYGVEFRPLIDFVYIFFIDSTQQHTKIIRPVKVHTHRHTHTDTKEKV